jgi:YidC/Oxa1 family membrane protein insertase
MTRRSAPAAPAAAARPRRSYGNLIMFVIIGFMVLSVVVLGLGRAWDTFFITPLINALVFLSILTLGNFGLAIILFTLLLRVATIPFTIRQLESTRAMQAAQPQMQEIQKKYKDPKRRQEEMMKLYREHGINPLGCAMPLFIQFVVFIALYRALVFVVGGSPESLAGLSQRLYDIPVLQQAIPLNQHFLWLNLGKPDTTFILPLLVGASTYVQQKMSMTPSASPQMQQQQAMMAWMMPLLLFFFTLSLPSGVGVYWVVSNVFSLFASYYVYGRRALSWRQILLPGPLPAANPEPRSKAPAQPSKTQTDEVEPEQTAPQAAGPTGTTGRVRPHGKRRGKRKNRR